jgi:regulator of RNase E activity RraA
MKSTLTPADLEALRHIDACTLANAIETFSVRLRDEGFADSSVRCLFPKLNAMVGYAVTVKIHGANPPVGARNYIERSDWWNFLLTIPSPRVVVVEDASSRPGLGGLLGEVHVSILRALGCVGAVTNGAVRDLPSVENMGFPLFAGNVSVSHSYVHIVEIGRTIVVGGMKVAPGDLLHGDVHGVQNVPIGLATRLPAAAAKISAVDQALVAICRSADFSVAKLRGAISASQS